MLSAFSKIWFVDFEFQALPGEQPRPICVVARELASGRQVSLFGEELLACSEAPYSVASDSLVVAFMASAELGCHLALGWPLPENVLDLYVEFRNANNGLEPPSSIGINQPSRFSLLQALHHYGLDPMAVIDKDAMRELAMRGGPWNVREQAALLAYCAKDCESLIALFNRMSLTLDIPRALIRGGYMRAVAHMEHAGIPIDTAALSALLRKWPGIQRDLIAEIDAEFGVYDGRSFRQHRFRDWLRKEQIDWPLLGSGELALDKDTFKHMAVRFTQVEPLRQLRSTLSQLRKLRLPVGSDGRGRTMLSPFASKTGRNQPSTTKFIFGLSAWSRYLIRPEPGRALAYIDWEQQEFGIAAGLSKDPTMIKAYRTGDPYLAFAKQAGLVPPDATKKTHARVREQFKECALAVQYCMGAKSLAERIGTSFNHARELLSLHRQTYSTFWRWSDAVVDYAFLNGYLRSTFGWELRIKDDTRESTIRNYPMQANGAEMLRLACCLALERGVAVLAPVHDALLIEAPAESISVAIEITRKAMDDASGLVLEGFRLRTEAQPITYPERFEDKRGQQIWETLVKLIGRSDEGEQMKLDASAIEMEEPEATCET